jgi:hypothetical protein
MLERGSFRGRFVSAPMMRCEVVKGGEDLWRVEGWV